MPKNFTTSNKYKQSFYNNIYYIIIFRKFAITNCIMTDLKQKRQWIGRILLTIYIMIVSANILHVHIDGPNHFICKVCIHQKQHSGHISTSSSSNSECLLCNFLATTYLSITIIALAITVFEIRHDYAIETRKCIGLYYKLFNRRGPPCL